MGKALEKLSVGQLENIARGLFKVKSTKGGELIGLCPVHDDKKPSFSYNPGKDVCHCFSCGFGGDIIKLWSKVKGYGDDKEGFKAFCDEFDISDDLSWSSGSGRSGKKKEQLPPLDDSYKQLGVLPETWLKKLAKTRGWGVAAMDFLGIRQQTYYQPKDGGDLKPLKKPERVAIPIYDKAGQVRNIRLYKPGKATGKIPKIISWGKNYGAARLFPHSPGSDGTVLLCEGESDTICAISNGFNAITQTTKPKKWSKKHLQEFKERDVVIAFDADQPGQKYALDYAGLEISKVARSVRLLEWPDFMGRRDDGLWPEDHGQDLTDFFVKHKQSDVDLQRLIDAADHFKPPADAVSAQALQFFQRGANDRLSFKPRLLAEKIMDKYQVMFSPDTGLLYRWNGRYWEEFFEEHLKVVALNLLGVESTQSWVNDAVFQVKALATIPHGRALNDKEDWVCVKNGMLNIDSLIMKPHAPDYYASYELGVVFNPDSKDKCTRWLQFLKETVQTPGIIMQVQEFFGYCFYKRSPFAKCLFLLGPGSDGKSKFLNILQKIIGEESCAAISFDEMEDQFLRSSLYQKSINVCGEVGSKILDSTYFKAVTAGDKINAAFKHKNTFTFKPYCKVLFSGNKMPRVKDTSYAFYRRILPIKFKKQFFEGAADTDPFIEEKLTRELSEIFQWAIVGLHRLLKNKQFTPCSETDDIMASYKRLNNPVLCFIQDECEVDEGVQESKKDLFKKYESYCRENNNRAYSRENFFRELYAAVAILRQIRPRKDNPGFERLVAGIKLKSIGGGI